LGGWGYDLKLPYLSIELLKKEFVIEKNLSKFVLRLCIE